MRRSVRAAALVIAFAAAAALGGCADAGDPGGGAPEFDVDGDALAERFVSWRIGGSGGLRLVVDAETGCQYLVSTDVGASWAVPLLDADGRPLITEEASG